MLQTLRQLKGRSEASRRIHDHIPEVVDQRNMKGRTELSLPHHDTKDSISAPGRNGTKEMNKRTTQINVVSPEKEGSDDRSIAMPSPHSPPSSPSHPSYVYRLDEDEWLDRELSMVDDAPAPASAPASTSRSIHLCVYHVRRSPDTLPFVQFMMAPPPAPVDVGTVGAAFAPKTVGWMVVDESIGIANASYPGDTRNGSKGYELMVGSTNDTEQYQTRAANACIEHILLTYPGYSSMGNFEFRGWFHTPELGSIAVVRAIELTPGMDTSIHPFGVNAWANLDEIMYQASWSAIPIDPAITQLFHQHPFFGEIVDQHTHLPIRIPMSLYMCNTRTITEGQLIQYTNVMRDKALPWIDPTIEHPWFGDHWYFSAVPIQGQGTEQGTEGLGQGKGTEQGQGKGTEEQVQRYAVFVDDPLTHALFRDISTELTDEDRAELTRKYIGNTKDSGTVDGDWPVVSTFFHEGGVPIWCIRDRNAFVRM